MKNSTQKIILTPQQIQQLKPYQALLQKAAQKQYIPQLEKKNLIPQLKPIYEQITGTKLPQTSCHSCSGNITWLGRLGLWYTQHILKT